MSETTQPLAPDAGQEDLNAPKTATSAMPAEAPPAAEATTPHDDLNEEELRVALAELTQTHDTLTQAHAELAEQKAATEVEMLRMAADFQNARKRLDRLAQDQTDRASQRFAGRIIAVLDDLELALDNRPETEADNDGSWVRGIEQIHAKIHKALEDEGVRLIESAGLFDPSQHEAVQQLESADHESGEIVDTVRPGYMFKDQVLRPAMVRIAS